MLAILPRHALITAVALLACARSPEPALRAVPANAPESGAEVTLAGATGTARATASNAELDRQTAELFGDALRVDVTIPVPSDSGLSGTRLEEPTWDIDVRSYETFDRVRHYVTAYSGAARDRFIDRLSRGTRYEALIRAKLKAGELPEDLYYLALVESGYNPHAYSRAAAVGMWQFMTTTARGMGLRVDWWIDERRDPVRSTEAAVRFLRGLNEQFGSLYLAAAAYNGGPGRVARGLARYANELEGTSGDDMFFELAERKYLRNETREYVPQLIAAALVAKEADRYGIVLDEREPFAYDSVRIGPSVPLAAIAAAIGSTVTVVQDLNPHILRGMTPPTRDSVFVRIPVGSATTFDSAFATLPTENTVGARIIKTEKGASWSSLARKNHSTAKALALYNPKVKPAKKTGIIATGSAVLVPSTAVVAAALSVPDPAIERYGVGTRIHVVRSGDNLSRIAKRYKTTPAALMRLNRLKKPLIFAGQELLVRR
jgi:membrane-bound lytic murein transglycosylase D